MKKFRQEDSVIETIKKIHMIGIGGSGMCPLAEILFSKGYEITGSDNNESDPLKRIKSMGIKVHMGHSAENIRGAQLVVYSAAIAEDNPEIAAAKELNIPIMERSHLLGALTRKYDNVIGVCGTHGKTTVTSLITQVFYKNNLDPTAVIGGRLPIINANGRAGNSEHMICEACEFVDTFLQMSPDVSVLLNIDNDHLDYFGTIENLSASFEKFVKMSSVGFFNGDDNMVMKIKESFGKKSITFGMSNSCDYYAKNITQGSFGKKFDCYKQEQKMFSIELSIPGDHNVYNALAAIAVADYFLVDKEGMKTAVETFVGAGRRFEKLGTWNNVMLADDYAHHPTEIQATLTAAKQLSKGRVVAIFQPFTFSRTHLLKKEFIEALSIADDVVLTPIVGSREVNESGIKSQDIANELKSAICVETFYDVANYIEKNVQQGDLIITMGGGDIYKAAYIIRERFDKKYS